MNFLASPSRRGGLQLTCVVYEVDCIDLCDWGVSVAVNPFSLSKLSSVSLLSLLSVHLKGLSLLALAILVVLDHHALYSHYHFFYSSLTTYYYFCVHYFYHYCVSFPTGIFTLRH